MSEPSASTVVLMRIEDLLKKQLERLAVMHGDQCSLHADLRQLLAVMVQKTSNGTTIENPESETP
jgi:hypothetical protein